MNSSQLRTVSSPSCSETSRICRACDHWNIFRCFVFSGVGDDPLLYVHMHLFLWYLLG